MADAKHTPGTWEFDGAQTGPTTAAVQGPTVAGRRWPYAIVTHNKQTVAICPAQEGVKDFREPCPGSAEANARLIAAAPDLLAELKALSRAYVSLMEAGRDRIVMLGGDCDPMDKMEGDDPALRSARAAIAKAGAT